MKHRASVVQLSIELLELEPKVTRLIEVPTNTTLGQLHHIIQSVMPWQCSHLYQFSMGSLEWTDERYELEDTLPDNRITLEDVAYLHNYWRGLFYLYDFGDYWDHCIEFGAIKKADPGTKYPRLISAEGACPPEDVGGTAGYAEFLAAILDPDHPEHVSSLMWHGKEFNPNVTNIRNLRSRLQLVAKAQQKMRA